MPQVSFIPISMPNIGQYIECFVTQVVTTSALVNRSPKWLNAEPHGRIYREYSQFNSFPIVFDILSGSCDLGIATISNVLLFTSPPNRTEYQRHLKLGLAKWLFIFLYKPPANSVPNTTEKLHLTLSFAIIN